MAYRFKLKEELQDGVRRIAVEQIEKALSAPNGKSDRVVWVHETRKSLKRLRSLLRLVRAGLGERAWREENGALRLIARNLSGQRDRDVLRQTMAALTEHAGAGLDDAVDWLEASLAKEAPRRKSPDERSAAAAIAGAIADLGAAHERLSRIDLHGSLADVVAQGLVRAQRTGRMALARLEADATDDNLHELRKSVQIYQRQHGLIQAAWPELQAVRVATARACAQRLGEAQDLAVLASVVKAERDAAGDDKRDVANRLLSACRHRHGELREGVLPVVHRLLALRPKAAGAEFAACWGAAIVLGGTNTVALVGKVASADRGKA